MKTGSVGLSKHKARFDERSTIARFGLIALATDLTSERDLVRMLPDNGTALHTARIGYENPTTPENLRKMAPRLGEAAGIIVPGEALRAVCYSCTAASVVIGDASVREAIHSTRPGVPVVTPASAACMAFSALSVRRITILTPYTVATSKPMARFFEQQGLDVIRLECFGLEDDREMARVDRSTIIAAAIAVDHADAEALFVSCTALPAAAAVHEIEQAIGKPVVTSNQASAWAMGRIAGFADHDPGHCGKLFGLSFGSDHEGAAA